MLELASLSRAFGGLVVIDQLDFKVEQGEIVGILGPNGAGKTTLFNMIAGVLPPSRGRIVFGGRDITPMKAVGSLPIGYWPHLSNPKALHSYERFRERARGRGAWRQDAVGARQRRSGSRSARASVWPTAHAVPAGQLALLDMKQLELAKALALRPRLLLLDEIAGGLTEAECDVLIGTISDVHRGGVTIVWIEHVIHALRRLVTRLAVLSGGNFIATGTPQDVLADQRVKEAYLGT